VSTKLETPTTAAYPKHVVAPYNGND